MIFKILICFLLGYLNIEVEFPFVERFVNICKAQGILLWNVKIRKGIILFANIGIQDFKKIKNIHKKTNTKIKIKKKCGVPFIFNKYKKRKIFFISILMIIIVLVIVSNFIWNIEIIGNENIEKDEIIKLLEQEGLKIGAFKGKIDTRKIINNIRLKSDKIAWIGIITKGTNAKVEIKERILAPKIIDENDYCNIVANKEGIITKITVQNGTKNVKEGDLVRKGDILVYGYLEGKYTGIRYVHASANIEAKVWYSKKEKVFLKQKIHINTGNSETKYNIVFNNFTINFYKTLSKFENYDTIVTSKKLKLFSDFYLPIEINKITNKEYLIEDKIYKEEELKRNYM